MSIQVQQNEKSSNNSYIELNRSLADELNICKNSIELTKREIDDIEQELEIDLLKYKDITYLTREITLNTINKINKINIYNDNNVEIVWNFR